MKASIIKDGKLIEGIVIDFPAEKYDVLAGFVWNPKQYEIYYNDLVKAITEQGYNDFEIYSFGSIGDTYNC